MTDVVGFRGRLLPFRPWSLESLCTSLEVNDICRCLMTTEQFFQGKNGAPVEEQRVPHFPCPGQHHQIRAGEKAKSGSPASLGGILFALGRHCSESGAGGAAPRKGEQRWDHPWPQVIVSFVTLLCQSLKKRSKAQLRLALGQFNPKIYILQTQKDPYCWYAVGTSYHSGIIAEYVIFGSQIHHFVCKGMSNSDLFRVYYHFCLFVL